MFFYDAYQKKSKDVTNINVGQMQKGAFYFLQYQDDSNWMQYSPIFTVDFKKFGDLITADHVTAGVGGSSLDNERTAVVMADSFTKMINAYPTT